ncbi:MAG: hypothetical protein E7606_00885 [Ruminococcaceae bacterium]|nr:hypothetical protein [Oscillospiraceae bacterium]
MGTLKLHVILSRVKRTRRKESELSLSAAWLAAYMFFAQGAKNQNDLEPLYNKAFADFVVKNSRKVFEGGRELFSKSSLHVLSPINQNL